MELRQLEYFLKVAARRSITAAAAELNITQPSLTKSIRLLEAELGVPLFERLPRGVALTVFGRRLHHHAQSVHVDIQDALSELQALRGGEDGTVVIGAGPSWLRRHLPLAVTRALTGRPRLQVRVVGGFDEPLFRDLRRGDIDFVVAELPMPGGVDDLELVALTTDDLVVCCRRDHELVGKGPLALETIAACPWALPADGTQTRRRLDGLFLSHGRTPPTPVIETESMAFLLASVRLSSALTYTTVTTLELPDATGLVRLDVPALVADRRAGIIHRRGTRLAPAACAIVVELQAICEADPQN